MVGISMGARRELVSAVAERYRSARRTEKGRILIESCAMTGWHRKHAVRTLRQHETRNGTHAPPERSCMYGATNKAHETVVVKLFVRGNRPIPCASFCMFNKCLVCAQVSSRAKLLESEPMSDGPKAPTAWKTARRMALSRI
jgi:hypothetical protein